MYEGPLDSLYDRLKNWVWWHIISPGFPYVRDIFTFFKLHSGRQPFHLGWLNPNKSLENFVAYLQTKGFSNHFIAWTDEGQVVSLRRRENFFFQYHLRVFKDGQICGHYEKTPEHDPIGHFCEAVFEPRRQAFLKWLGGWIQNQPTSTGQVSLPKG